MAKMRIAFLLFFVVGRFWWLPAQALKKSEVVKKRDKLEFLTIQKEGLLLNFGINELDSALYYKIKAVEMLRVLWSNSSTTNNFADLVHIYFLAKDFKTAKG